MTLIRVTFVLILVMGAMLLAVVQLTAVPRTAGGMGQVGDGKTSGNGISTVPITSPIPITVQNQTPQANKYIYWIMIDPISDKQVGETFTITATTNLSAGEEILVSVYSSTFSHVKVPKGEFNGVVGTVRVIQGEAGINRISFVVNSTVLKPDEFIISETTWGKQIVTGTALFNVIPKPDLAGNITLKPKKYIDWDRLDLPELKINQSIHPGIPDFSIQLKSNRSDAGPVPYGSIIVFSADGVVRFFNKDGIQTAAYYDYSMLHSTAVPSGSTIGRPVGNVSTITYNGERILTEIFEAGDT